MITDLVPTDWANLQDEVAAILSECGFETEIGLTLQMARGQAEIDVYARETLEGRVYTVICECKDWKSRVPQSVVHGFRTVVVDTGANAGYVIGSAGFQSGAVQAIQNTNVKLCTWEEFQREFEGTWLAKYMMPRLEVAMYEFLHMRYTRPRPQYFQASPPQRQQYDELVNSEQYMAFHTLIEEFEPGSPLYRGPESVPRIPLDDLYRKLLPSEISGARSYRELLSAMVAHANGCTARLWALLS